MANTISISVVADVAKMKSAIGGVNNDLSKMGQASQKAGSIMSGTFKALGAGALVAGAGMFKFGTDAVKAASDLNETVSKTKVIFGDASTGVIKWGEDAAKSMGLSKNEALTGISTFGNFFQQIGFGTGETAKMSKNLVQASVDLGSFHNAAAPDVMNALASATRGEYDALQQFIPTINAASVEQKAMAMTGKESADALTAQEKAAAMYQIVMGGMGAAQGDFARTSDSLANQQKILGAEFENVKAKIGTALLPVMLTLVEAARTHLVPALERLGVWLSANGPAAVEAFVGAVQKIWDVVGPVVGVLTENWKIVVTLIGVFYAITAAIAAYNVIMSAYHAIMTAVRIATIIWTNAQFALNLVMLANPLALVVVAIAALIAIIVIAWKNSETFRDIVIGAWNAVKAATSAVWDFIKNALQAVWEWIKSAGEATFNAIKNTITTVWNNVKEVTSTVWNAIKSFTEGVWNGIKNVLDTVWGWIKTAVTTYFNVYKTIITTAWDVIKNVTSTVWNAIKTLLGNLWDGIKSLVSSATSTVKNTVDNAWDFIKSVTSSVWNFIKGLIDGAMDAVRNTVSSATSAVRNAIDAAWDFVRSNTTETWNKFKSIITDTISNVLDAIRGIKDKIMGFLSGIGSWLYNAGKDLIQGFINGIKNMASSVISSVTGVIDGAKNKAKSLLGIGSPSKVFRQYGKWTVQGLVQGLDRNRNQALEASRRLAGAVSRGFEPRLSVDGLTGNAGASSRAMVVRAEVKLTADEISALERGRSIQMDLDAYASAGGRVRA